MTGGGRSRMEPRTADQAETTHDVAVIGGALAGSAFALMLKRALPEARVVVVERSERFERRVGEATVEASSYFLNSVLGLWDHLSREHLPKHGLRFWHGDGPDRPLHEMSELGPCEMPALPSYQLDRSVLDEHVHRMAADVGTEMLRPARAVEWHNDGLFNRLVVERDDAPPREITARWVVDATGRTGWCSRRLGIRTKVPEHPTAALWGRFRGVRDMDGQAVLGPDRAAPLLLHVPVARRLATNHFCGRGWWAWVIPLAGGETSIGVVWHQEMWEPPGTGTAAERLADFCRRAPGLRELTAEAEAVAGDTHLLRDLAWRSEHYMQPGWALVGDAAGFMDPLYSPGLDHMGMTIQATVRVLTDDLGGAVDDRELHRRITAHDENFRRSYERWLDALYIGKYDVVGEHDLMDVAFHLDTGLYMFGVVNPIYADPDVMGRPVMGTPDPPATVAWRIMRFYNRRLAKIARTRLAEGRYGEGNVGRRHLHTAFRGRFWGLVKTGLRLWLGVEWRHLTRRFRRRPEHPAVATPVPSGPLIGERRAASADAPSRDEREPVEAA